MITYRDLLNAGVGRLPWAQGDWGQRLIYALALLWDATDEAGALALKSAWFGSGQLDWTTDSLEQIGVERRMPKYPAETYDQYAVRLWNAWRDYQNAGGGLCLIRQLSYWGIPSGSTHLHYGTIDGEGHGDHSFDAESWWSQFWIVCVDYPTWANWGGPIGPGEPEVGDVRCGISGATDTEIASLRALILKWKPSKWVCRSIIFEVAGERSEIAIQPYVGSYS